MLNKEVQDFTYHEFKTDSDSIVRDLTRVMTLGIYSKEVSDSSGNTKPATPSMEYNWRIVNPRPDFSLTGRDVDKFEDLTQREYEIITEDQLSKVKNKVVIECITKSSTDIKVRSMVSTAHEKVTAKYLEIYMPKYLCDTETEDPFAQEINSTRIPKCINPRTGTRDAIIRNYHWILMRAFDVPNEDFSGPKLNKRDLITGEFLEFNSASSEWVKLAWFTDFEEVYRSSIPGYKSGKDPIIRIPVSSSLTNKTKIKVMANVHPNRMVISVVGNPNVDYGENRYLISMAYIGSIDSFKGSKSDIEGNFGLFATSSSVPSVVTASEESAGTFSGLPTDETGAPVTDAWKKYDQSPGKVAIDSPPDNDVVAYIKLNTLEDLNIGAINSNGVLPGEQVIVFNYKKRGIPADPNKDSEGGSTGIDETSIRTTLGLLTNSTIDFTFLYEYGTNSSIGDYRNKHIIVNIPTADLASAKVPVKTEFITKEGSLTETIKITIAKNDLYKFLYKYIEAELAIIGDQSALTPGAFATQRIRFSGRKYLTYNTSTTIQTSSVYLSFYEKGTVRKVVNKTQRDSYGNMISIDYPKTFGKHTANGTTDFAMYKTDSADFWQSHYLMFSSTEQFMNKHMYGKSAYTGEYFADRIKVTHAAEGVRGVMSGIIVIDADSLFAFDELIVNKDYEKEIDKAEETYVYIPITAPYCPFSNSPNERNGVGLLKSTSKNPYSDEAKCDIALDKVSEMYIDSLYHTNGLDEIVLVDEVDGIKITWTSSCNDIIDPSQPIEE